MSRKELLALKQFLDKQTPIVSKNRPHELSFPFNLRPILTLWKLVNFDDAPFQSNREKSQACHQEEGVGENPIPSFIARPGYLTAMPLNETSHAWHHTDEQLIHTILNGLQRTGRMPAWKDVITEQQASDVLAYIKSLWSDRILDCQGPKHMSCM